MFDVFCNKSQSSPSCMPHRSLLPTSLVFLSSTCCGLTVLTSSLKNMSGAGSTLPVFWSPAAQMK